MSAEQWRESSPEDYFSRRWLCEFESIHTQNISQRNLELAAFTEEECAVRAEVSTLLHYRLHFLGSKFDAIASQRRRDHRVKLGQHFANAVNYMRAELGSPRPSDSELTATRQPEACSIPQPMPMECEEAEIASAISQPPFASPQAVSSTPNPTACSSWVPLDEPILGTPGSSTDVTDAQTHGEQHREPTSPAPIANGIQSIDFDEVYQNGTAKEKHMIIQAPMTDKWYILRCKHLHFGLKPMIGAMRHLASGKHGPASTRAEAIQLLGVQVRNCDAEKAEQNNVSFHKAWDNGYRPFNAKSPKSKRAKRPTEVPSVVRPEVSIYNDRWDKGNRCNGATCPRAGDIYQVCLGPSAGWYAVVVLPTGEFDSISLSASLLDTVLVDYIPECYRFDERTMEILGWQQGFEDGGPNVNRRIFPVMYPGSRRIPEDGDIGLPDDAKFAWISADSLRPLDLESTDSNLVYGCQSARDLRSRISRCGRGQAQASAGAYNGCTDFSPEDGHDAGCITVQSS